MDSELRAFHAFLQRTSITLHPSLSIVHDPTTSAFHILATAAVDAPRSLIARIPKRALLSHRNSSFYPSSVTKDEWERTPETLKLAACVLHELELGSHSPWAAYLDMMPRAVYIGQLWDEDSEAVQWAKGTGLEEERRRIGVSEVRSSSSVLRLPVTHFPTQKSLSIFHARHQLLSTPQRLVYAYALVSSRSFQIDAYHRLALVPVADLFNHLDPTASHVHFESEDRVCPECGSFDVCAHDLDGGGKFGALGRRTDVDDAHEEDDAVDLVSDLTIAAGVEVFNTYGPLSNARLLAEYGFTLDANPNDRLAFALAPLPDEWQKWLADFAEREIEEVEEDELVNVGARDGFHIDADARLSLPLWTHLLLSSASRPLTPDDATAFLQSQRRLHEGSSCDLPEDEIQALATSLISLCEERRARMYRPTLSPSHIYELAEVRLPFNSLDQAWGQLTRVAIAERGESTNKAGHGAGGGREIAVGYSEGQLVFVPWCKQ